MPVVPQAPWQYWLAAEAVFLGVAFLGAALVGTGREEAALEVEVVFLGVTAELDMIF